MLIYKILSRAEWAEAEKAGRYDGSPDDHRDGFIHLSSANQVRGTAEKYFRNQNDLALVSFEAEDFGDALKWEPSRGGALFPHLYASLETGLAKAVTSLPLGDDGVPIVPDLGAD